MVVAGNLYTQHTTSPSRHISDTKRPHLLGSSRSSSAAICFGGGGVGGRNVDMDVGVADVG